MSALLRDIRLASLITVPLALLAMAGACGDETTAPPGTGPSTTSSSGTPTTSGGGNDGGNSGTAMGGSGGTGAAGGGSGATGGGDVDPLDRACSEDIAFRADGAIFKPPTPQDLALALTELTYDVTLHPVTVVLQGSDPGNATIAASQTMDDGNFNEVFVTGFEPGSWPGATIAAGGFSSNGPQSSGYLRIRHLMGNLDLQLTNLSIIATTSGDCAFGTILIDAIIPSSQRTSTLEIASGSTTIGDLAGGSGDINVGMVFQASAVAFDFSTL